MAESIRDNEGSESEEMILRYLQGILATSQMEEVERSSVSNPEQSETIAAYSELLDEVADHLMRVVPPVNESVRTRILAIAEQKPISQVIRASGGEWVESGSPGTQFKFLFQDPDTKKFTLLARSLAGGRMPPHRHVGVEECLVLEGSLWTDGVLLQPGDYIVTQDQTVHEDTWSPNGALVLLKTYLTDEVLA